MEAREAAALEIGAQDAEQLATADIFPGRKSWTVRQDETGRHLEAMTWGFPTRQPRKREPKEGQSAMITTYWTNARDLSKSMWSPWLAKPGNRCLVPFSSFAEPKAVGDRASPKDLEWWFRVIDQDVPCFAGLYKFDRELGPVFSFCTTEPNSLVGPKHPKAMPVILTAADHHAWLTSPWDEARELVRSYPTEAMVLDNR